MRYKILIAEDEPDLLKLTVKRLEMKAYEVKTAQDGKEAVEVAKRFHPDLIILDIKLPEMDGYTAFHHMRKEDSLKHVPVIFATADVSIQVSDYVEQFNFTDVLMKPYSAEDMHQKIEKYLSSKTDHD